MFAPASSTIAMPRRRYFVALRALAARVLATRAGRIGGIGVLLFLLAALAPQLLAPFDPIAIDPAARFGAPGPIHPFGTDQLGRDLLSRVLFGTQMVLIIVCGSIGLSAALGVVLGLIAGYGSGFVDALIRLFADVIMSLPMMLFALAVTAMLGGGLLAMIMVIGLFQSPTYFRVVRAQTLSLKQSEYVVAAQAMGASSWRITFRHIFPNLIGQVIVLIAMDVPTVIGIESGLSFLGMGVQPPVPTWGTILRDGYASIRDAPHIVFAGGIPVLLATIAFTMLGEALRDALDPRMTGRLVS